MKQTKNSVLSLYLQHIRDLVKMLEKPDDWEFVIGDTSIIDDGGKERLYFINEISKKIEIAIYKKNLVSSQKYNINELESLFTGLGVVANLSNTRNKNDRIKELKNILVQELTDIQVENVSFENDGINKQYILLNKNQNYVNLVNKFNTVEFLMKNENPTALEKIVLDKLKNIFELDPVRSWALILKETYNEYETNYNAKVLISSFSKESLINSLKKYIEHHIEEKIGFNNRDIVYTLKYFNIFSKINKNNKDEFEKLLDFCFYNFAKSMISEFGESENKNLRFNIDLIRLFRFIEFDPNSLNKVTDEFLDDLLQRLVFSIKTILSENNKPVYLSQEFYGELSKDWAYKVIAGGRTTATMDNLRLTLNGLKNYNKFLEKLIEVKDDINFFFKDSSLTDVFVLSAYGRNDEGPLGSINNELRYYSESKIAKNFLLEHRKSCELFSKLISEESPVLKLYKMDVDFLMKKIDLMSRMNCEKLDPKKENTNNSKDKGLYFFDDGYFKFKNSSSWYSIEPLRNKITF